MAATANLLLLFRQHPDRVAAMRVVTDHAFAVSEWIMIRSSRFRLHHVRMTFAAKFGRLSREQARFTGGMAAMARDAISGNYRFMTEGLFKPAFGIGVA